MDPTIIAAVIGAVATISAAVIALQTGKKQGRAEKEKEIDDAPRKYVNNLDKLIKIAMREGATKASINARAIVSTRNDLKESTIKIADRLNSEINVLERQQQEQARSEVLMETIEVLSKKWPAKKDQIEIELRKVLAEMGLLGRAPKQAAAEDDNQDFRQGGNFVTT